MLDTRKLRVLHALAEHGTVAAVAEAMHVTGPAVSQQLAALERELGVQLLTRNGRRLALTHAGQVLAAHAQVLLDQLAAAEADLADLRTKVSGSVRVAAFATAAATLVPAALRSLRAAHGDELQVRLFQMEPEESLPALRRDEVDVAVTHAYTLLPRDVPPTLEAHDLLTDPVHVALSREDPLHRTTAPGAPVALGELSDRQWVVPRNDVSCREVTQRACGQSGFVPRAVAWCDDFRVMFALVDAGMGAALVPGLAARDVPEGVVLHPLADPVARLLSAVTRHSGDRHPAVRVVLQHLTAAGGARRREAPGPLEVRVGT